MDKYIQLLPDNAEVTGCELITREQGKAWENTSILIYYTDYEIAKEFHIAPERTLDIVIQHGPEYQGKQVTHYKHEI